MYLMWYWITVLHAAQYAPFTALEPCCHLDAASLRLGRGHSPYHPPHAFRYRAVLHAAQYAPFTALEPCCHLDAASLRLGRGHSPYKSSF